MNLSFDLNVLLQSFAWLVIAVALKKKQENRT